jgi:hypothetical protein
MMTRRIKCVAIAKGLAFSTERVYNTPMKITTQHLLLIGIFAGIFVILMSIIY